MFYLTTAKFFDKGELRQCMNDLHPIASLENTPSDMFTDIKASANLQQVNNSLFPKQFIGCARPGAPTKNVFWCKQSMSRGVLVVVYHLNSWNRCFFSVKVLQPYLVCIRCTSSPVVRTAQCYFLFALSNSLSLSLILCLLLNHTLTMHTHHALPYFSKEQQYPFQTIYTWANWPYSNSSHLPLTSHSGW